MSTQIENRLGTIWYVAYYKVFYYIDKSDQWTKINDYEYFPLSLCPFS